MERAIDMAQHIFERYKLVSGGNIIDEMKLHKLLYFTQRESIAVTGKPMFPEKFFGWKYGPVCKNVRLCYSADGMVSDDIRPVSNESAYIADSIVAQYGGYESWKLSELSHKEISWRNARKGLSLNQNGDRTILLKDIRKDAAKVRPYDPVYDMYYDEFEDAEGSV